MNFYNSDEKAITARAVQELYEQKEAEKKAKQALEEKRHKESLALTEKNVKLMDENNKICRQSLRKSIVANWIAGISAFIAFLSLCVAIYALLTK